MTESIDREIGRIETRIAAVEADMQEVLRDVRQIRDKIVSFQGGWKVVGLIIAISASVGGLIGKLLPALTLR